MFQERSIKYCKTKDDYRDLVDSLLEPLYLTAGCSVRLSLVRVHMPELLANEEASKSFFNLLNDIDAMFVGYRPDKVVSINLEGSGDWVEVFLDMSNKK